MMKTGEEKDKDKDKEIIDDESDKPRHCCICSSIDGTRLMIRCDYCEQWYHGDCIGLEKETCGWIKRYACPPCSEANPEAKTVYKEERGKDLAEKEEPDGDKEDPEKASREMLKNTKKRKKPKIPKDYDHLMKMRDNQKDLDKAKETTGDKSWETRHCGVEEGQGRPRRKAKVKFLLRMKKMMRDQETTGVDGQVRQRRKAKVDNHRKRKKMGDKENGKDKETTSNEPRNCGLCCSIGRTRVMICCDYCHEWYHRDCIGIGRDAYRCIIKYACPPCASLLKMKPEDQIVYEEEEAGKDSAEDEEEEEEELDQVLIQETNRETETVYVKMEEPDQELIQTSQEAETVYSEDQESNDPAEMENKPDEDEEDTEKASGKMLKNSEKREMLQNIKKRKNQWKLQATKRLKMQANARRKMIEEKTYLPSSKQEALKATETASRIRPYKAPAWQSRQCGQCGPCKVVDDCRKCGFCLDRKRFGGRKELRQKCRLKQCIRLASIPPPAVDVSLVDHFFYIKRPEIDPTTEEKENKGAEDMERQSESIEKQKEPEKQPSKEESNRKQSQQKPSIDEPKSKHFLRSRTGVTKGETSVAKPKTTEKTTKAKETTKTKETTGRKALSIAAKVKIIQEFENRRTGRVLKRKVDIARKWGITPNRLAFILEKKGTLMEQFQHQCDAREERKRTRKATIAEVEQAVLMWCKAASAMNIPLSGPLVQEKARALSKKMGRPDYPCNDGWWDCFKIQHSITFLAIAAQVREMVTDRSETGLNQVLEGYEPWDIFNADETGILYRRLPDRSLTCKGKTCNGGEGSEERLTAMVCANMDGSEKLPLLVIGKSKKPQCLANVKSLPMQYEANKTAWMTPDIFEAWAHNIDKLYQKKNRKIAIIVDICPAHPRITDFKSINLVFRPTITTAKLQPMKQGVIQNLKTHYRRQLITSFLAAVDKKEEYNPTVLDAMFLLQKAWKMVKESTISHGFKLAGFHNKKATAQNTETAEPDADINSATQDKDLFDQLRDAGMDIPRKVTLKSYAAVDANVRCTMELNDDAILDAVLAEANDVEDDDEPPVPPCPAVSIAKATRYLDKLRNFALQSEHTEGMFSAICDIEEVIGLVRKGEATRKRNTDVLLH